MATHVYVFNGQFYHQVGGGPIGLRSTACLTSLMMKLWDTAWIELLKGDQIDLLDLFRYVDDVGNFLQPLRPGVRWNVSNLVFSAEAELENLSNFFQL